MARRTAGRDRPNAPAPSNTTAIFRKQDGASDTDDNGSDFVAGAPVPAPDGADRAGKSDRPSRQPIRRPTPLTAPRDATH